MKYDYKVTVSSFQVKIAGEAVLGMDVERANGLLMGPAGTRVAVTTQSQSVSCLRLAFQIPQS